MWRNYLTVGLRALAKSRTYALINILGLSIGLAACLLLLLYVRYESSFDRWLPDSERVFQVQMFGTNPQTGERLAAQGSPRPMVEALAKDFPQIEAATRMEYGRPVFLKDGETISVEGLRLVDEPFFDILQLPFLRGDRASALGSVDTLVLSRTEAEKIFGTIDVVGRTLTRVSPEGKREFRVTGVFEDLPKNSHLEFSMLTRFNPADEPECGWSCVNGDAYLKLKPGADVGAINRQMPAFEKRNITPEDIGGARVNAGENVDWRLTNVRDVHLGEAQEMADRPGNDRRTILTFTTVALLILAMAVVNFVNLATSRASQRAREVALRKVLGATRGQLVGQFLGEAMLLTTIAMLVALAFVELSWPALAAFLEADMPLEYFGQDGIALPVLALTFIVGLGSGLYPAFFLSRYQPAEVLKANKSSAETRGSGRLRQGLVVLQFAISIGLIICTAIVYKQTVFAQTADAGFERQGLLQIDALGVPKFNATRAALRSELMKIPGVVAVSGSQIVPASTQTLYTMVEAPGQAAPVKLGWYSVDPTFFETMKIRMLAGRNFAPQFANDRIWIDYLNLEGDAAVKAAEAAMLQRGMNVVVSEEAARRIGFRDAREALGKQFRMSPFYDNPGTTAATIVGVTSDARFRSARDPIEPIIYYDNGRYSRLVIRHQGNPAVLRERAEQVWKKFFPDIPFRADFADEKLAEYYEGDVKRGQSFASFTLLAVVIACLGLFGLAAFTAERRTKEIGIRKVLGARVGDIVQLLAWQFSKPVIVANLIAWPAAWWVMRDWLNTFDARIDLGPGPFVVAGILALAIAIGTIAGHAVRVARMNPIHALRYE